MVGIDKDGFVLDERGNVLGTLDIRNASHVKMLGLCGDCGNTYVLDLVVRGVGCGCYFRKPQEKPKSRPQEKPKSRPSFWRRFWASLKKGRVV